MPGPSRPAGASEDAPHVPDHPRQLGLTLGVPLFSNSISPFTKATGSASLPERPGQVEPSRLPRWRPGAEGGGLPLSSQSTCRADAAEPDGDLLSMPVSDVVLSALPADSRDWEAWRAEIVLDALAVPVESRDRPLHALSGGWQRSSSSLAPPSTEPTSSPGRADEPSRSRLASVSFNAGSQHCPRTSLSSSPAMTGLSRRCDEPHAVPAARKRR